MTTTTKTSIENSKCTVITLHDASELPRAPIDGKPTLVYWDIVGICHPLRLALAHANVEWCDVRLVCGGSSDMVKNKQDWYKAKQDLKSKGTLDFPNLPYLLDDGNNVRLTQSGAILRYLSHKYSLLGSSDADDDDSNTPLHVQDMLCEEARDLDSTMVRLSYEDGEVAVGKWLSSPSLGDALQTWWESCLSRNGGKFLTGDRLTMVDLQLYTFLYKMRRAQYEQAWDDNTNSSLWVHEYMDRVEAASPALQAYIQAMIERRVPVNNPHAKFCNG